MTFSDLESTWAQQPAAPAVDLDALKRALKTQLGRRRRILVYVGVTAVIGLVAMQAIFLAGIRAPHPESPWVSFGRLMLHQVLSLALLFEVVRAWFRHRRLAGNRAASVREVVRLSLAGVEGEMMDYRIGQWIVPVLGAHGVLSIYLNKLAFHFGWAGFGGRLLILFALYGLIGFLGWRHYHRVLTPRREELKETLRQLNA